jgi:hypothetical protein
MLILGKQISWNAAKKMQNAGFIWQLQSFNKLDVSQITLKKLLQYTRNEY